MKIKLRRNKDGKIAARSGSSSKLDSPCICHMVLGKLQSNGERTTRPHLRYMHSEVRSTVVCTCVYIRIDQGGIWLMVIDRKKKCSGVRSGFRFVRGWANNKILDLDFGSWTFNSNLFQHCGKY
jgi:hypothetical protein